MNHTFAELYALFAKPSQDGMKAVIGTVKTPDPLIIEIDGTRIENYRINKDIALEEGDLLFCLISDGGIFILCRME